MNVFKKILLLFFSLQWIKSSQRKKIQPLLNGVPFRQLKEVSYFLKNRCHSRSVLIIEANPFHGEVIPGLAKHFNELGYHSDVLVTQQIIDENPFVRCEKELDISVFKISFESLKLIIHLEEMLEYETIVINSTRQWEGVSYTEQLSFKDYFGIWPRGKNLPILMEHDITAAELFFKNDHKLMERVITLGRFSRGMIVNSHYFGPVREYVKNKVTTFTLIGEISTIRRNHQLIIDALLQLAEQDHSFRLLVIGAGSLAGLPAILHSRVEILGRLSFADMYNIIEKSDFLIAGLDPDIPLHDRYITTGVTGSAQLCYGFSIPPIIEKKFAAFYGFNESNSLIYERDPVHALKEAIEMNNTDSLAKRKALGVLAQDIRKESIKNLRKLLYT